VIVISGVLVLVAAVLLFVGILWSLTLVYAAIALAIAGGLVLLISVFYRPRAPASASASAEAAAEAAAEASAEAPAAADPASEEPGLIGADVMVVSGRPHYHVPGCGQLVKHDGGEPLEISEARDLGFTSCGDCRPDENLARGDQP
jgi:hypothetical protein